MRWLGGRSTASAIPTPQVLLRSVYVGRMCVAVAIYLSAALKFKVAAPFDILVTSLLLVATVVVTWMLFWMRRQAAALRGDLHARLESAGERRDNHRYRRHRRYRR